MDFLEGFINLLSKLSIVYFFIGIGIIWRFSKYYQVKHGEWVTNVILWVFFPISIIGSFGSIESLFGQEVLQVILIALLVHFISFFSIYLMNRTTREEKPGENGALILCATFPNALLFPFPIILSVVGDVGIYYAAIFVFIAMTLRNTFGVVLGIIYDPLKNREEIEKENKNMEIIKRNIINMLKFPPFLALIIGILIYLSSGPETINNIPGFDVFKSISLYGSLLLIGISFKELSQLHPKNLLSADVGKVSISRFLVAPITTLIFLIPFSTVSYIALPLLIQSMAPSAISNVLYAKYFNLDESKISLIVTFLTLLALVILPFELFVLLILFPV
ncbi:MAG: AEC family transporter [Candidatus Hodarchaeales archaeon]